MRVVGEDSHMACPRILRTASKSPTSSGSAPHISMLSSSALFGIICCWAQFLKILFDELMNQSQRRRDTAHNASVASFFIVVLPSKPLGLVGGLYYMHMRRRARDYHVNIRVR